LYTKIIVSSGNNETSINVLSLQASNVNGKQVAATWSDNGTVFIWDLTKALHAVNDLQAMKVYVSTKSANARALHSFTGHQSEGFAMDWSSFIPGWFLFLDASKIGC